MRLLLSVLLVMSFTADAQDFTEKINVKLKRTDYYDVSGKLIGYSQGNPKYNRIEYYDSAGILVKTYPLPDIYLNKIPKDSSSATMRKWNLQFQCYDVCDTLGQTVGYYKFDVMTREWNYYNGHH